MPARVRLLLALLLAAFGMSRTFGEPFGRGWLGHNAARYALIARNYERHGFLALGGAPLLDAGEPEGGWRPDGPHDVYAHHPPGLSLTIGALFRVFGVREDVARAVPFVATLLLLVLFARLVGHVAGAEAGSWAALVAACLPMVSVYGAHVDVQGAPVLCASVGVLLCYRRWLLGGDVRPLLLVAAIGSAFDWYALYTPVLCAGHALATRPERRRGAAFLLLWPLLLFATWLSWLAGLPGQTLGSVLGAASVRTTGSVAAAGPPSEVLDPFRHWLSTTQELMPGWPLLLLVVIAVLVRGGRAAPVPRGEPIGVRGLIVLLLLPPLLHAALFPAGLVQHSYWLFALPLPIAAAVGITLVGLPAVAPLLVAGLLFAGVQGARAALAERDELPALVGRVLSEQTAPSDVILTNYKVNPFLDGAEDEYALMRPAVTFYADRVVRGLVDSPEALERALARRPESRWFLSVPLPQPASPELLAAVAARSEGEPLRLSDDPPALLFRLRH